MRESELANARVGDLHLEDAKVAILLPLQAVAQAGESELTRHASGRHWLLPWCRDRQAPSRPKKRCITLSERLSERRASRPRPRTARGKLVDRFAGHGARVAGAQFLAKAFR